MGRTVKEQRRLGLVLSTVPGYSETFFRNKIQGLQQAGFQVVLFVDYLGSENTDLGCDVIVGKDFGAGWAKKIAYSFMALIKSVFLHPKRSFKLYRLNKQDGIGFKANMRQLILNQFFLNANVDWLHFGFGMLSVGRENVAQAMGARMAVSFRGFDLYLSPLKHPGCYDLLFKKELRYHVLSYEMKEDLKVKGIPESKIYVITPAIDISFFKKDVKTGGDKNTTLQLLTVSRLHWKKGLEYTLEALAMLKGAGIPFHYTVIGTGEELERLVFAAHQLNISEVVTFAGRMEPMAVREHLAASDIYLQYSVQEGFCNAVLEAQAMGLLCVVSDAEGLAENVLDGKTGWVVPKRQPDLLASKIMTVMQLPEAVKTHIQQSAIERVRAEFHLEQQRAAFFRFFTE